MPLAELDHAAIARTLAQIADRRGDLADVFFEESELVELPADNETPGLRVWRQDGLAVRLLRRGRTWIGARDGISAKNFAHALRQVARAMPRAPYPEPRFSQHGFEGAIDAPELLDFPAALARAVRSHHVSFPLRLTVRRHRRHVRIIGTQLSSGVERESFYSVVAEMPWGRYGTLLPELGTTAPDALAANLVHGYRAHKASPPEAEVTSCVLGPSACAVLLHEAVAHALEADTLALSGDPEAAIGVEIGPETLNVFDDPSTAPASVRRRADDEGHPVVRRCLLRQGRVDQPLADELWARASDVLRAGAGRRADRHLPPGPRSLHLELMPGTASREELFTEAEGGLYLPEADRGHLDPMSGEFVLQFPYGYRLNDGAPGPAVGRSILAVHVTDVLRAVRSVGREPIAAGAGWCAKGGMKLPVWATTPELLLADVQIRA